MLSAVFDDSNIGDGMPVWLNGQGIRLMIFHPSWRWFESTHAEMWIKYDHFYRHNHHVSVCYVPKENLDKATTFAL